MPALLPIASGTLACASFALTFLVIGNAYYHKGQFYPSVVYVTKSNPSMAAIYLQAFTIVLLFGKFVKKIFFGQLRAAELEQLVERSFYAVTETCLAFTVFRDDFSPKFVALFTILLFLKAFHYLTDSRVDFMERSPAVTKLFHLRVSSLILFLFYFDVMLVYFSYQTTMMHGPSVQLVFGFEYAILLTVIFNVLVKYICHTVDLHFEAPWDNKAVYLLYTELLVGFVKVILYGIFLIIMIRIHTFPLFIIRPMYLTLRSFKNALNGVIQSRRAIHNMNTLYADATPEELIAADNVCIICREEMTSGAKKLPCNHIFHTSCLRSWFQRQQTCPTCRMDILRHGSSSPTVVQQPPPQRERQNPQPNQPTQSAAQNNPQAHQQFNLLNGNPPNVFPQGMFPPQFPFMPFPLQQAATSAPKNSEGDNDSAGDGNATGSQNTFPFSPMALLMPTPPINLSGFTREELLRMEGVERANVEARVRNLRNIQTLLDAASFQLSQYYSVVNTLRPEQSSEKVDKNNTKKDSSNNEENISQKSDEASDELGAAALVDPEDTSELRRRRLQKFTGNQEN